ncbi:cadherin-like beta sandwich domain-containing protein [Bacillus sp. FJAT-49732]|uniref:Cadherin-like beta sandwich domain-containing protein n=1 Tax=Lederbergia citrisecunda TaxID=2833583 RepID=A0A942YQB4_9BACI|nr:cadherin-like beta sandwich domain-containing protein [Lederbergia citrisecunda]MBS4202116.1 cadherin-like beta sandwich domain-containing protein [Lederbergia citrisecunda]
MKKNVGLMMFRIFLITLLLTNLQIFVPSGEPEVAYAADEADQIHYTITGPNSVTFSWHKGSDVIRYGKTSKYEHEVRAGEPDIIPRSSPGPWREAKLMNLEPETEYHYAIGDGPDYTFKTAPLHGSSGFSIVATGDIGSSANYDSAVPMNKLIKDLQPDMYIGLGDYTYANAGPPDYSQESVNQYFNDVMEWSREIPFMPIWGNHEWDVQQWDDLRNYKGRFDLPNSRTEPTAPPISCCGKDWYWFDYGNTRFIAMTEPYAGSSTWNNWKMHAEPLFEQAENDPDINFIVTLTHRQAWSTGYRDSDMSLQNIIRDLANKYPKFVLNLSGHDHHYERTNQDLTDGVVTIISGAGGAGLHIPGNDDCLWKKCPAPDWSAKRFFHYGVVKLDFKENEIKGQFVCGPPGGGTNDVNCEIGEVVDNFTVKSRNTQKDDSTSLSDIRVDGRAVNGFKPNQFEYKVNVPSTTTSVNVTAALQSSENAKLEVQGGDNLAEGDNTVTLTVTSQTGKQEVYTINVHRASPKSGVDFEGTGTVIDPYIVMTAEQLDKIRNNLTAHYQLGANIDLSKFDAGDGQGWKPIGDSNNIFSGSFDGNGYVIKGLMINRDQDNVGLFGFVSNPTFKNIRLENVNIKGKSYVGAIAGLMNSSSGGLIENSYATGEVSGSSNVGGLVGDLQHSRVFNSYAIVNVKGTSNVGGLVGRTSSSAAAGNIKFTYAAGEVSNGGGLIGSTSTGAVVNSYWDNEKGPSKSAGGEGKTTKDMQQQKTFANWDFGMVWEIDELKDYPRLKVLRLDSKANERLLSLQVNGEQVSNFNPNQLDYDITVRNNENKAIVSAILLADHNSSVEIIGAGKLNNGENLVQIKVISRDGNELVYNVSIIRDGSDASSNRFLRELTVDGKQVEGFSQERLNYTVQVPYETTSLSFSAIKDDPSATLETKALGNVQLENGMLKNLSVGDNTVTMRVTAEDGTKHLYILLIVRGPYILKPEEIMEGDGTKDNPYIVMTPIHLDGIRRDKGAYYKLGADIDLTNYDKDNDGKGFMPISDGTSGGAFMGTLDGNGYKIKGLTINRPEMDHVGLFGYIYYSATLLNILLEDVNIKGRNYVGAVTSYLNPSSGQRGTYDKWYATGTVEGANNVGGLIGGTQTYDPIITNIAAAVDVKGTGTSVGGLIGALNGGKLINAYSVGKVSPIGGGLIGTVSRSPEIISSYWDIEASTLNHSAGGIGKSTEEMKKQETYVDWDFDNAWKMDGKTGYPILMLQNDEDGEEPEEDIPSIQAIRNMMEDFISSGDLAGPLVNQLKNKLDQAEHQLNKGSTNLAAKKMQDFLEHLNNPAMKKHGSNESKEKLNQQVNELLNTW